MPWLARNPAEIGIGLTGFGVLFTFLGIVLFFDRALLSMGNLLFISGVALTIGPNATVKFFLRKRNRKGSVAFFSGVGLLLMGWAFVGMLLEGYGVVVLFAGFLPTVLIFLKKIPMLGKLLDAPGVKTVLNKIAPNQLPV